MCNARSRGEGRGEGEIRTEFGDESSDLVFDGGLVQIISTNGTGVGADIPGPHGDSVPFLNLEARGCPDKGMEGRQTVT